LGSFITLGPVILPSLIKELMKAFPQIHLEISEGTQENLMQDLKNNRIDVALLYDLDLSTDINCVPLSEYSPYVALPNNHELAQKKEISLSELVDLPLILLDVAPSRSFFLGLFEAEDLKPTIAHTSPSLELVRGMVGCGLGYSLLVTRPHGDKTYDGSQICIRRLKGSHSKSRIVLGSLASLKKTRSITCLEQTAQKHF
jgi:DNA-binding transcriptional LysR family regulator